MVVLPKVNFVTSQSVPVMPLALFLRPLLRQVSSCHLVRLVLNTFSKDASKARDLRGGSVPIRLVVGPTPGDGTRESVVTELLSKCPRFQS